jgi:hypothetical protein
MEAGVMISKRNPGSDADRVPVSVPKFVRMVFAGGMAGLLIGLAALFVVALVYGEAIGLAPGACALFACSTTVWLSQAVGAAGMIVGAAVGAVAGGVVYYVHHHMRRP